MKPGLTEYIKFSDGIQEKFGGLFVASYLKKIPYGRHLKAFLILLPPGVQTGYV
jgi:hypothetical protein